jgi:hypothetical protein
MAANRDSCKAPLLPLTSLSNVVAYSPDIRAGGFGVLIIHFDRLLAVLAARRALAKGVNSLR